MTIRILVGDCRDRLKELPDKSVHCCVSSPPYFGLRDYGTAAWDGGSADCDHMMPVSYKSSTLGASTGGRSEETHKRSIAAQATPYAKKCGKCGATRIDRQMGLEPTPDEFVAGMVAVFREVRRVLRDDGTLWLNIGDSYAMSGLPGGNPSRHGGELRSQAAKRTVPAGTKAKDLIGIPWMLAFALRADGWYLRQEIIWAKPNPMPESVRDRCTKAHEQIFLLSKRPRYYFDAEAIAEPGVVPEGTRRTIGKAKDGGLTRAGAAGREPSGNEAVGFTIVDGTRNRRSVWTVSTQPFSEAHFATYPPALVEPCILAGCPKGGTVLDPFGGAGTTGLVSDRLGRDAILIELNPEYAEIARKRLSSDGGMFADVRAESRPESAAA